MERLYFFRQVKSKCDRVVTREREPVWRPIIDQLKYLISFETGEEIDRTMIQNIDVGLRALRNLEDVYPEVAKDLFEVQRIAERMAVENGMRNRLSM